MQRRAFSRNEVMFLIGVPLAWAILLLFHPGGEGDQIYQDLQDKVTRWQVVHVGMMLFIPLFAAAVYLLVRGVEGTAAQVSRIGLALFVVFYGAFELLQGVATGILVNEVNGLPQIDQATREELVQDFAEHPFSSNFGVFNVIGGLGLIARNDRRWCCSAPPRRCATCRFGLADSCGVAHRCTSAAIRTHRLSALYRRRRALCAKPVGSPGTGAPRPAGSRVVAGGN